MHIHLVCTIRENRCIHKYIYIYMHDSNFLESTAKHISVHIELFVSSIRRSIRAYTKLKQELPSLHVACWNQDQEASYLGGLW